MSISDPLIKDLKGCTIHFLEISQPVSDDAESVREFCEALERILQKGLLIQMNTFGYWKDPQPWHWMQKFSLDKYSPPYLYQLSVDKVRKSEKVRTDVGRTRLLIRHCLNNRCLHIPFKLLMEMQMSKDVYTKESVLGSYILSQILLSVVLLPSSLQFKLDVDNARFLDDSWLLPSTRRLTLVPSDRLGISLTFVEGKAIVVEVLPDSVASEDDQIEVGDVLDELNSVVVGVRLQGCLGQVMKRFPGQPITAYTIKAKHKESIYPPLVPLLRKAELNPTHVLNRLPICDNENNRTMEYMGRVLTADRGDVKEIRRAINHLLTEGYGVESPKVVLDCHDMGISITRLQDSEVILKHAFMQISSCGCTVQVPNYFAYIVEDHTVASGNRAVQSAVALKGECRRRFLCYSLYAWLLPLAVTGLTLLVDSLHVVPDNFLPNMGSRYCWFAKDTHGLAVFFNLPVMVQVTTNLAFFALTVRNCSRIRTELRQLQGHASDDHRRADLKYRADLNKLVMNTKLCIVMGVTWGCEVLTWYFQLGSNSYWWYLLDAANILQGFFIFLIFVIKKKVLRAISGRARAVVPRRHQPSTSSTVFTTVTSDSARAHTLKHA